MKKITILIFISMCILLFSCRPAAQVNYTPKQIVYTSEKVTKGGGFTGVFILGLGVASGSSSETYNENKYIMFLENSDHYIKKYIIDPSLTIFKESDVPNVKIILRKGLSKGEQFSNVGNITQFISDRYIEYVIISIPKNSIKYVNYTEMNKYSFK